MRACRRVRETKPDPWRARRQSRLWRQKSVRSRKSLRLCWRTSLRTGSPWKRYGILSARTACCFFAFLARISCSRVHSGSHTILLGISRPRVVELRVSEIAEDLPKSYGTPSRGRSGSALSNRPQDERVRDRAHGTGKQFAMSRGDPLWHPSAVRSACPALALFGIGLLRRMGSTSLTPFTVATVSISISALLAGVAVREFRGRTMPSRFREINPIRGWGFIFVDFHTGMTCIFILFRSFFCKRPVP